MIFPFSELIRSVIPFSPIPFSMLSGIVDKYSDVNQELMVYNCGEFGAARLWNNGVYSTNYSKKVIKKIDEIKSSAIQSVIKPKS